jgi:hypothetical protein
MSAVVQEASRRGVAARFWALSVVVIGAGMFVSSLCYPEPFEWRFGLISTLLSYKDNPGGYLFATGAVVVAPLLLIPVFREISRAFRSRGPRLARAAYGIGIVGLAMAAVVGIDKMLFARFTNRVHKLHEILAGAAFVCLMIYGLMYGLLYLRSPAPRWQRALTVALVIPVPIGMAWSQWYLHNHRPELGWVGPDWKELDLPIVLSFAVWQWLFLITGYVTLFVSLQTARPAGGGQGTGARCSERPGSLIDS